jgi:hypothetical protein
VLRAYVEKTWIALSSFTILLLTPIESFDLLIGSWPSQHIDNSLAVSVRSPQAGARTTVFSSREGTASPYKL